MIVQEIDECDRVGSWILRLAPNKCGETEGDRGVCAELSLLRQQRQSKIAEVVEASLPHAPDHKEKLLFGGDFEWPLEACARGGGGRIGNNTMEEIPGERVFQLSAELFICRNIDG